MKALLTIPYCRITIYDNEDGSYSYVSDMMIDGDGTGPSHGDPDYQCTTSYKPDLNADIDQYIVLPPQVFMSVEPVVMGCKATVERTDTPIGETPLIVPAVVADVGPHFKIGEASIATARALGVPSSPITGGDFSVVYRYTFWPGVPAVVNGRKYNLQPYV